MDLIIEIQRGNSFTIEIGYFDSVYEIKEKIQKYKEIPISQQTLVFNGNLLNDNGDVESCVLLHNSHIQLILPPSFNYPPDPNNNNNNNNNNKTDNNNNDNDTKLEVVEVEPQQQQQRQQEELPSSVSKKTRVVFKLQQSSQNNQVFPLDVNLNDSVEQLKGKLHEIEGYPVHRLALYTTGNHELQDHRHLREYELTDDSEIEVLVRPPSTPTGSGMSNPVSSTMTAKKLKVVVLTKCGTKKLFLEVNPNDKVQVLRTELEKKQQGANLELPSEGYFFIYKQNVMEEKETFQWHNVRQGDFIEIFNGSVTGGV